MKAWWQTTSIYQIYPRSFADANGDGIGDLEGIISKLEYIQDLGFESIWISPFYPSPLEDHGYDITDYRDVAPEYGDMETCKKLLEEAHARGMKVLLDMVLNHTSDQHPWFVESRSSRDNPKADYYIWREGKGSKPPNNWIAVPGGRGWHYDAQRDQWYMASFLPFQPDLNWRNPEVKEAMFTMVREWLRLGVDGFRLDLFTALMKDAQFRNNPFGPGIYDGSRPCLYAPVMQHNHPDTFAFAKELRAVVDEFGDPDRVLLGEVLGTKEEHRDLLGGERNDGLNLVFIFDMVLMLPWQRKAKWFRGIIEEFERHFPAPFMPTYVFGNHDMRRLMSKIKDDLDFARCMALFQLTTRGVPTVYMGEEIGMTDVFIPKSAAQDPISKKYQWAPDWLRALIPMNVNRDMNRTPMQWNAGVNAGFCPEGVAPWLPVNEANKGERNVESQQADPASHLNLYRDLLHLRRESIVLREGALTLIEGLPETCLGYYRVHEGEGMAILINFGKADCRLPFPEKGVVALRTRESADFNDGVATLPAKSGLILRLSK